MAPATAGCARVTSAGFVPDRSDGWSRRQAPDSSADTPTPRADVQRAVMCHHELLLAVGQVAPHVRVRGRDRRPQPAKPGILTPTTAGSQCPGYHVLAMPGIESLKSGSGGTRDTRQPGKTPLYLAITWSRRPLGDAMVTRLRTLGEVARGRPGRRSRLRGRRSLVQEGSPITCA